MNFLSIPSLLGYFGTLSCMTSAYIIAKRQRTNALYWTFIILGNVAWLTAGYMMDQPAVMFDVLAFMPIHTVGIYRFIQGIE